MMKTRSILAVSLVITCVAVLVWRSGLTGAQQPEQELPHPESWSSFPELSTPILIEMLDRSEYAIEWSTIIGILRNRGESDSLSATLIEFILRDENETLASLSRFHDHVFRSKYVAVRALGRTRGEEADAFMRKAITEEGAYDISKEWIDEIETGPFDNKASRYLHEIRSSAAVGLANSQGPENLAVLKRHYEIKHAEVEANLGKKLQPGERSRHMTSAERDRQILYYSLAESMAISDLIQDIGEKEYRQLATRGDMNEYAAVAGEYVTKYTIPMGSFRLP